MLFLSCGTRMGEPHPASLEVEHWEGDPSTQAPRELHGWSGVGSAVPLFPTGGVALPTKTGAVAEPGKRPQESAGWGGRVGRGAELWPVVGTHLDHPQCHLPLHPEDGGPGERWK